MDRLQHRLGQRARQPPDVVSLIGATQDGKEVCLTARQLEAAIGAVTCQLEPSGLPHLGLLGSNSPDWLVAQLAAWRRSDHPGYVAYCASKAGLEGFTEALSRELEGTSVRVPYLPPVPPGPP